MWNAGANFRANSTAKNAPKARDFAASAREVTGLGIKQCSEMGLVFCGETDDNKAAEAGGRTAGQAGNNFFATINLDFSRHR